VVAEVEFNEDGRASRITAVESPSNALWEAVERAVALWRFGYGTNNGGCSVKTKITYYFLPQADAKGHVIDPLEENAGLRFRSAAQRTGAHAEKEIYHNEKEKGDTRQ